jgi:cell division protein FtsI (penicillin-binding protein 3)
VAAPIVGALVQRMAPLMGISPIPDDSPLAQNPLVAMVADYDSAASKKAKSKVIPATVPIDSDGEPIMKAKPFGATPVSAKGDGVTMPPDDTPVADEGIPLAVE